MLDLDLCNGPFVLTRAFAGKAPLVKLTYVKSGALPSVDFVKRLPRLKDFVFLRTDVADGDMSPLLEHPMLSYVAFTKKRHFSHSDRGVNEALGKR